MSVCRFTVFLALLRNHCYSSLCQALRWYSGDVLKEQSENCLSPAPARYYHFFLLSDFTPLSRSLEQATVTPFIEYKKKYLRKGKLNEKKLLHAN